MSSVFLALTSAQFLLFKSHSVLPSLPLSTSPSSALPSTLPTSPSLPVPELGAVLTLGFIQIYSLQNWKVVMRAKKNSLALSLTTRLVFLMKPNENSIFSPCYSLPPILHLSLCSCASISGASKVMTNFLIPLSDWIKLLWGF